MALKFIAVTCLTALSLTNASDIIINSYRMDPETDPKFFDPGTLRITKKSRNMLVVSGSYQSFENLGDDYQFMYCLKLKSPVTGNYRIVLQRQMPVCEFMDTDTNILPKLREVSNISKQGECPVPRANYTIQNFKVALPETLPLSPGDYLVVGQFIKDGVMRMGLEWDFTVLP
ncbi:uncharacterized protein LOC134221492 [Armigeres subalbatus]|uniref:uncharacterized protein LOC134221492 n=1 Tax=Armigeres subalbatus TaxID=124917 RepID=UPI002ED42FBA